MPATEPGQRSRPCSRGTWAKRWNTLAANGRIRGSPGTAQRHVEQAGEITLGLLRPRRGRPDDLLLEVHVKGLVALLQEMIGTPVIARRHRNSVYDPHFADGISQLVAMFFRDLDESITVTHLVEIVRRTRSEYAGEPLRFSDLFPLYGASVGDDGEIKLRPGYRLEAFEPNIPIYCP